MVIVIGENFFDGLQVVFGSMLVWSEVGLDYRACQGKQKNNNFTALCRPVTVIFCSVFHFIAFMFFS